MIYIYILVYSTDYDKYIFTSDFNTEENEVAIKQFILLHGLKNLVNVNTCFKSLEKPRCIDLFLTLQVISKHMHVIIWLIRLSQIGCNCNENRLS